MKIEKVICDRCGAEVICPATRKLYLSKIGREGGLDLCDNCHNELDDWFLKKVAKPDVQIYIQALAFLRDLMTKQPAASCTFPEYFEDDFFTLLKNYKLLNEFLQKFANMEKGD